MQLRLEDLTVNFPAPDGGTLAALNAVSFEIEVGSFVALLGPSGSGKSTLIRAVAGLQKATSGQILFEEMPILEPHQQIAMMFQDATLMPWRTVLENIALPLEIAGLEKSIGIKRISALLPALGLEDFANAYPAELSGGMAQRVALGRVLIQEPRLLLLDEPFGALDAMTREKISFDLLRLWEEMQQTVIMVTHDINEAVLMADRVLVLSRRPGRLIADIKVPLERPRKLDMIYTSSFAETAREIRQTIDKT